MEETKELMNASISIIIPVFNDWKSLELLLIHLDEVLTDAAMQVEVMVIDDGSTIHKPCNFITSDFKAINKIEILELRRNLGHQRAIALGLAYIEAMVPCQAVVVMDGDGEDAPKDVIRLINKYKEEGDDKIIFARRNQRSESLLFKLSYIIYKWLYKLLTGQQIRVGNFSIIPYKILHRLVVVSEIWNHYASGVLKARIPYIEIPTKRNTRLAGRSKMNFVSLVTHGLSAISVYGDIVGVRLLVASCLFILFTVFSLIAVLIIKFFTALAIPGWTSYLVAIFFVILIQCVMLSLFFIFVTLSTRNNYNFLPNRDYQYFILTLQKVFTRV
jgi:glycosyltransferase involved in cell wall biosynthesis